MSIALSHTQSQPKSSEASAKSLPQQNFSGSDFDSDRDFQKLLSVFLDTKAANSAREREGQCEQSSSTDAGVEARGDFASGRVDAATHDDFARGFAAERAGGVNCTDGAKSCGASVDNSRDADGAARADLIEGEYSADDYINYTLCTSYGDGARSNGHILRENAAKILNRLGYSDEVKTDDFLLLNAAFATLRDDDAYERVALSMSEEGEAYDRADLESLFSYEADDVNAATRMCGALDIDMICVAEQISDCTFDATSVANASAQFAASKVYRMKSEQDPAIQVQNFAELDALADMNAFVCVYHVTYDHNDGNQVKNVADDKNDTDIANEFQIEKGANFLLEAESLQALCSVNNDSVTYDATPMASEHNFDTAAIDMIAERIATKININTLKIGDDNVLRVKLWPEGLGMLEIEYNLKNNNNGDVELPSLKIKASQMSTMLLL